MLYLLSIISLHTSEAHIEICGYDRAAERIGVEIDEDGSAAIGCAWEREFPHTRVEVIKLGEPAKHFC